MSDASVNPQQPAAASRWQPLGSIDRRVLGVLAEKAKTTPDIYPMSLNAICTGCNQKSNRDPLMQLEPEDVEESLDRLRGMGAVGLIEGYGRVAKYRHYLYEWLGVDKVEIAVMIELLLRGDQTVGELRTRASRMEPIADLNELRVILDALRSKKLVVSLTPEGRGHVVTHALYKPRETEVLRAKYAGVRATPAADEDSAPASAGDTHYAGPASTRPLGSAAASPAPACLPVAGHAVSASSPTAVSGHHDDACVESFRRELDELRAQVNQLRQALDASLVGHERLAGEVQSLKDALGG